MPGVTSQGVKFYYGGTPVQVVQNEASSHAPEHESADVTNLDSTAREHLPLSLMNNGDIPLTLTWDAAAVTHAALATKLLAGTVEAMKITFPKTGGTATYSFNGFVASIEMTAAVGTKQVANAVIRITGAVTPT